MKYIFISLVLLLSSCQTFKQWQTKGIEKKWLDTTTQKKDSSEVLKKDTTKLNALVDSTKRGIDNVIDSTYTANQTKPCPQIRDTIIVEVEKYLDNKFKPKVENLPVYKDDSLGIDNPNYNLKILYKKGKLFYKISYKQCIINTPYVWYKNWWWIWLIAGFSLGVFIMWLANKSTK